MDLTATVASGRRVLDRDGRGSGERLAALLHELTEQRERQRRAVAAAAAELAELARGERASSELRAVQRRIDRGELSWERVALGQGGVLRGLLGDSLAGLPAAFARAYALVEEGVPPEEAVGGVRALLTPEGDPAGSVHNDGRPGR